MFNIDIYEEFPIIGLVRNKFDPKPYELIGILKITECKLKDLANQIDSCTYTDYYAGSFIFNEIKSAYEDLKDKYPNANEPDIDGTKRYIMDEFCSLAEAIRKFKDEVDTIWVNICCYGASSKNEEETKSDDEKQEDLIGDYIDDLSKPFDFKLTFSKLPICRYASILSDDENEWRYGKTIKVVNDSVDMVNNIYNRLYYRYVNNLLTVCEFFAIYDVYRRLIESMKLIAEITSKMLSMEETTPSFKPSVKEFEDTISKITKHALRINTILFKIDIDPDKIEALK